jgi:hypothetical protein
MNQPVPVIKILDEAFVAQPIAGSAAQELALWRIPSARSAIEKLVRAARAVAAEQTTHPDPGTPLHQLDEALAGIKD